MTTDEIKKHGMTAGIAAIVAIAASLALRPTAKSPMAPPSVVSSPTTRTAAVPNKTPATTPVDPVLACHAHSGLYDREDAIETSRCSVTHATSPATGCGRVGAILVRRTPGTPDIVIATCAN